MMHKITVFFLFIFNYIKKITVQQQQQQQQQQLT